MICPSMITLKQRQPTYRTESSLVQHLQRILRLSHLLTNDGKALMAWREINNQKHCCILFSKCYNPLHSANHNCHIRHQQNTVALLHTEHKTLMQSTKHNSRTAKLTVATLQQMNGSRLHFETKHLHQEVSRAGFEKFCQPGSESEKRWVSQGIFDFVGLNPVSNPALDESQITTWTLHYSRITSIGCKRTYEIQTTHNALNSSVILTNINTILLLLTFNMFNTHTYHFPLL